jgi:hypothetical protein
MHADVAEHELGRSKRPTSKSALRADGQEEGLAHVGQDEADLGLGGRQFADVDLAAHVDQGRSPR